MEKGIVIEIDFYKKSGKFIGGSIRNYEGSAEAVDCVIDEASGKLDELILCDLAKAAGVKRFRKRTIRYSFTAKKYDVGEEANSFRMPEEKR